MRYMKTTEKSQKYCDVLLKLSNLFVLMACCRAFHAVPSWQLELVLALCYFLSTLICVYNKVVSFVKVITNWVLKSYKLMLKNWYHLQEIFRFFSSAIVSWWKKFCFDLGIWGYNQHCNICYFIYECCCCLCNCCKPLCRLLFGSDYVTLGRYLKTGIVSQEINTLETLKILFCSYKWLKLETSLLTWLRMMMETFQSRVALTVIFFSFKYLTFNEHEIEWTLGSIKRSLYSINEAFFTYLFLLDFIFCFIFSSVILLWNSKFESFSYSFLMYVSLVCTLFMHA